MSRVFVIGAGASCGETLKALPGAPAGLHFHEPPVTNGFFRKSLLDSLGYTQAEQDFKEVIDHIRWSKSIKDPFGEGEWEKLDLEEVFTGVEVEREFQNPESDLGAELLLVRNSLIRYIRRIIGLCTRYAGGEYYGKLCQKLKGNDSVITFNWDLLLDHEFIQPITARVMGQYSNFFAIVKPTDTEMHENSEGFPGDGLFLKLHGSLNWYRCGNRRCPASADFTFLPDTQRCLTGVSESCRQCGSEMNPIIVPPVLRKSIAEDPVIRSAWGLARSMLTEASQVTIVGFSAAPTDFYAAWLLRSTVGIRATGVKIEVFNPDNDPSRPGHGEFGKRMLSIFPHQYDHIDLHCFSQIEQVLGH